MDKNLSKKWVREPSPDSMLIIYKKIDFAYDKISPIRNIYYNCSNKL